MRQVEHLFLEQEEIAASAEWDLTPVGWCLVRFSEGVGYYFGRKHPQELVAGNIIIVPPGKSATFRASQLASMRLSYFHFRPELLNALLTLSEQQRLAIVSNSPEKEIRCLPANHPMAKQFTALMDSSENPLLQRCQMLALIATLFESNLKPLPQPEFIQASALAKFLELIQKTPEAELLICTPADLARRCGCSVRHFTRLFRTNFGASVRSKQTQLRLEKARQLLCDTDAKVHRIALDSGYRHLGLFNLTFKKHFGITPTQFRRTKSKPASSGMRSVMES